MKKQWMLSLLIVWCWSAANAQDPALEVPRALGEVQFNEQMRALRGEVSPVERSSRARRLAAGNTFSSLQVKAVAAALDDDTARYEFALAAYPRTVDPENYYEVYDAFKSFSKVMRLHDRLHEDRSLPNRPRARIPRGVTKAEFEDMIRALRAEGLDSNKQSLARQIIGARDDFSCQQIKQILAEFPFESSKVEMAKFAFDHVFDPANYFMLNEAFHFSGSKEALRRFVESRRASDPAR